MVQNDSKLVQNGPKGGENGSKFFLKLITGESEDEHNMVLVFTHPLQKVR